MQITTADGEVKSAYAIEEDEFVVIEATQMDLLNHDLVVLGTLIINGKLEMGVGKSVHIMPEGYLTSCSTITSAKPTFRNDQSDVGSFQHGVVIWI